MAQQQTPAPVNPAEAYERLFVPALAVPWAEDLLGRVAPQPGERVLDVACGTGTVARLAAPRRSRRHGRRRGPPPRHAGGRPDRGGG